MKKKLVGILVCMLFIAGAFTGAATIGLPNNTNEVEQNKPTTYDRQGTTQVATVRLKMFNYIGCTKNITRIIELVNQYFPIIEEGNNTRFDFNGTTITLPNPTWAKPPASNLRRLRGRENCSRGINVIISPKDYLEETTNGLTRMRTCSGVRTAPTGGIVIKDTCNETNMSKTLAHELLHALGLSHDQIKWRDPDSGDITSKDRETTVIGPDGDPRVFPEAWLGFSSPPHGYGYWDRDADCFCNFSNNPAENEYRPGGFDIDGDCDFGDDDDKANLLWGYSSSRDDEPSVSDAQREYIYDNAVQTPDTRETEIAADSNEEEREINSDATDDEVDDVEEGRVDITGLNGILKVTDAEGNWTLYSIGLQDGLLRNDSYDYYALYDVYMDVDDDVGTGEPGGHLPGADYKATLTVSPEFNEATLCRWLGSAWICFGDPLEWTYGEVLEVTQGENTADIFEGHDNIITIKIGNENLNMDYNGYINAMAVTSTTTVLDVMCGDVNNDGVIDISDVVYLSNYVLSGGPAPIPYVCVGDVNGDGVVDTLDVTYLGEGGIPVDDCCEIYETDESPIIRLAKFQDKMPVVNLASYQGLPGTELHIFGMDFIPWTEVKFYFNYRDTGFSIDTDGEGDFEDYGQVVVPELPPGYYPLKCVDAQNNYHVRLFEVLDDTPVVCGDANGDGSVNVGDAVFIINYVFKGGPAPDPVCAGDANNDGGCNVGDAVYIINYVFKGGPAPGPDCCP